MKIKRLIFISSVGSLNEVTQPFSRIALAAFKKINPGYIEMHQRLVKVIESSDFDYTIIRPGSLTNADKIAYSITHRDEPFKGLFVSRKSVADFVVNIIKSPNSYIQENIGLAE